MIPFRFMVDVDVRKQYYADYILVVLFFNSFLSFER